jgi:hypothetical protein
MSLTWASCDADSGSGLRDGMGRRAAWSPLSAAMAAIHCSEVRVRVFGVMLVWNMPQEGGQR